MNNQTDNPDIRNDAADAWLEVHLEEELGEVQAPDLRHRVMASNAEQRAAAALRSDRLSRRSTWLAAAALLIGIATVIAVIQATAPATPVATNAPDQQDPKSKELIVKTYAEFQKHVKTATKMTLTAGWLAPQPMIEANTRNGIVLDAEQLAIAITELQRLKRIRPAGWTWGNRIRIDLPDGRFLTFSIYKSTVHRVGIRGLTDFNMSEKLRALLVPLLKRVELQNRLLAGDVRGREDLLRQGEYSIPLDVKSMRCRDLEDGDLALLTRWTKLTDLDLSGSRKTLNGTTFSELLKLPLIKLNLRHLQIDERHLDILGQHPTLRELNISTQSGITGACGTALAKSQSLRSLILREAVSLTDEGIESLTDTNSVTHLDLSYNRSPELTTAGLSQLREMRSLQSLSLTRSSASMDELMSALGELPNLRELDIRETNVSNVGIAAMHFRHAAKAGKPPLPLRTLDLTLCKGLQEGLLSQLGGYLNLEHLILSRSSFCTVDATGRRTKDNFQDLLSLQKLQRLELNGTRVDAEACKHIARLPSLTYLDLSFTGSGITDQAVEHLSDATNLEHLELTGCDEFGDKGLLTLTKLKRLKHLDLNTCDGMTADGVAAFRKARPDCELKLPSRLR